MELAVIRLLWVGRRCVWGCGVRAAAGSGFTKMGRESSSRIRTKKYKRKHRKRKSMKERLEKKACALKAECDLFQSQVYKLEE